MSILRLCSNESPYGPSPLAVKAMEAALADSHIYPDNEASALRQKLAVHHDLHVEQIMPAAGLTSLLDIIARTLLSPGLNAIAGQCSFIVYPMATRAAGGVLVDVPMRDYGIDLNAVACAINKDTRIIFLANPNNPTGTMLADGEIESFLQRVPEQVVVVLDEAYYDFARHIAAIRGAQYSRSLDFVRAGRNVVVLRTFSKAHGLAAIRVAYGMGPAELMKRFADIRSDYSLSSVAQAGALAAMGDEAHTRLAVENNAREASRLHDAISEMGYRVISTWGNFVFCDVEETAAEVARRLYAEGVLICPLGNWGAPRSIRVTVGTSEQNGIFLQALRKVTRR